MSVYDKKLDPSIRNEVVTATLRYSTGSRVRPALDTCNLYPCAQRVGHSMVPHSIHMTKPDDTEFFEFRVKDNFFQVVII